VNDKCVVFIYRCYIRDDRRSIAVAVQAEAANRLRPGAFAVMQRYWTEGGKGSGLRNQVWIREKNASEPLTKSCEGCTFCQKPVFFVTGEDHSVNLSIGYRANAIEQAW